MWVFIFMLLFWMLFLSDVVIFIVFVWVIVIRCLRILVLLFVSSFFVLLLFLLEFELFGECIFRFMFMVLVVICWILLRGVGFGWFGENFCVIIEVFFGIFFILILFCILKVLCIELVICLYLSMFIFENVNNSIKKYISNDIKLVNVVR